MTRFRAKPVVAKIKPGESYQSLAARAEVASKKAACVEKANKAYPIGYQMTQADWVARRGRAEKEKQAHELASQLHGAAKDWHRHTIRANTTTRSIPITEASRAARVSFLAWIFEFRGRPTGGYPRLREIGRA